MAWKSQRKPTGQTRPSLREFSTSEMVQAAGEGCMYVCVSERGHQEDGPVSLAYSEHSVNICGMLDE